MRMESVPGEPGTTVGVCDKCGAEVYRYRGQDDISCYECDAIYNCFGQRLRDDLYTRRNYSEVDDGLDDLEGYEQAMLRSEAAETW